MSDSAIPVASVFLVRLASRGCALSALAPAACVPSATPPYPWLQPHAPSGLIERTLGR